MGVDKVDVHPTIKRYCRGRVKGEVPERAAYPGPPNVQGRLAAYLINLTKLRRLRKRGLSNVLMCLRPCRTGAHAVHPILEIGQIRIDLLGGIRRKQRHPARMFEQ